MGVGPEAQPFAVAHAGHMQSMWSNQFRKTGNRLTKLSRLIHRLQDMGVSIAGGKLPEDCISQPVFLKKLLMTLSPRSKTAVRSLTTQCHGKDGRDIRHRSASRNHC